MVALAAPREDLILLLDVGAHVMEPPTGALPSLFPPLIFICEPRSGD